MQDSTTVSIWIDHVGPQKSVTVSTPTHGNDFIVVTCVISVALERAISQ